MRGEQQQQLQMTPLSLATGVGTLLGLLTAVTVGGYFFEGYVNHHWWSLNYIWSFAIPFSLAVALQYVIYVPYRVAWDRETIEIDTWLRGSFSAPWSQLSHWGSPGMTFTLEFGSIFGNGRTFQIALNYFTPDSVRAFRDYLATNHSPQQANFWIGRHGVD